MHVACDSRRTPALLALLRTPALLALFRGITSSVPSQTDYSGHSSTHRYFWLRSLGILWDAGQAGLFLGFNSNFPDSFGTFCRFGRRLENLGQKTIPLKIGLKING